MIASLVASGVKVYALAPDFTDSIRVELVEMGAKPVDYSLSRTGIAPLRDVLDTLKLVRILKRIGPDAVFSYFIKPVIYGSIAAFLARVPLRFAMIEGLGYVFATSGPADSLKRRALREIVSRLYAVALARNEKVFFLNVDDVEALVGAGTVSREKVVLLDGIGVDLDEFREAPPVLEPVTFMLAARMLREKGVYEFVGAARFVRERYPEVRFLLVGGADENPGSVRSHELAAWADEGLVEWPGKVPDVRPWLARASVFVLPSFYREGLPRSTQEAMAMARPVITTDMPGCRETVVDGVNGYFVPPRDAAALAAAMIRFIENRELIETMGRESRRMAASRFDVRAINRRLLDVMGVGGERSGEGAQ